MLTGREPLHVTLRAAGHVWNLRSRRCFTVFAAAVAAVARRAGEFRVVHYSVQGNHVHLIVEASSPAALSSGMNALTARFARGLNRLMGTRGKVFPDRYHAHALRTPREARNAVAYSLGNFASHARRRGDDVMAGDDRFTSAGAARIAARLRPSSQAWPAAATSPARTWLLRGIGPP